MFGKKSDHAQGGDAQGSSRGHSGFSFKEMMTKAGEYGVCYHLSV